MVTSMQRPTGTGTNGRWRLATIAFAIAAVGALLWAFSLLNRVNQLEAAHMQMPMMNHGSANTANEMQPSRQNGESAGHSSATMATDLGPADTEYDKRFIDAMIPHHESAVDMAQDALKKSRRPEIKKMAQAIIDTQKTEINQLRSWRRNWY